MYQKDHLLFYISPPLIPSYLSVKIPSAQKQKDIFKSTVFYRPLSHRGKNTVFLCCHKTKGQFKVGDVLIQNHVCLFSSVGLQAGECWYFKNEQWHYNAVVFVSFCLQHKTWNEWFIKMSHSLTIRINNKIVLAQGKSLVLINSQVLWRLPLKPQLLLDYFAASPF